MGHKVKPWKVDDSVCIFKNGNHIALEGDSEHLSTSDCHSSNIIQCCWFSEGTIAGVEEIT